jgi:hypothetical protein
MLRHETEEVGSVVSEAEETGSVVSVISSYFGGKLPLPHVLKFILNLTLMFNFLPDSNDKKDDLNFANTCV